MNFKPSNGLNPSLRSMKLLTVVGARPQFIKAAMMSRALMRFGVTETILHTGQHYDFKMSELFFDELSLACPKYNLGVGSGSHGKQTSRMLEGIEAVLLDLRPDMVMTYGEHEFYSGGNASRRPNSIFPYPTSRPVCALSTARCRKRLTGSWLITWPIFYSPQP